MTTMQDRVCEWHETRFPDARMENVALKMCEEAGEVARAINGVSDKTSATSYGNVGEEAADVIITLLVLLGRWFPEIDLSEEVITKLNLLETPGAHRASAINNGH